MEYKDVNKVLKKYENIHEGETAVLVGGGPSIDKFKPIKDALYVGVNWIGKDKLFNQELEDFITVDYYFMCDRDRHMSPDFKVKKQKFCSSLIGEGNTFKEWPQYHLTHEDAKKHNAIILGTSTRQDAFYKDISNNPIRSGTVTMAALLFILYTGVSKLYLVGQDCSGNTAFGSSENNLYGVGWGSKENKEYQGPPIINCWNYAKKFINKEYPEVEIISINPVKLKGFFKDEYTK